MATAWFSPSMYNIVKQNGRDVNLVVMPDHNCAVNSGLGSTRGAKLAELSYSTVTGTQPERLTEPLVWRYGTLTPTAWDDAIDLAAEVTRRVVEAQGEDGLIVSAYDHGGAGGGYENTWATGKLYFESMKIKNIRIHNRPAYNSEVHGTRDMGVGELNNCYEDAELADTIMAVGTNALETQTNYFLNHWVPNLRGTSADKKKAEFGTEPIAPAKVIFVDPRRTPTIAACEAEAGAANMLHLAINPGTDLALFNALFTEIAAKGWVDHAFITASTNGYDDAVEREPYHDRTGRADHRPEARRHPQGRCMDRRAEAGRRTAADYVRLREGADLGQRQLPHQPGAGEYRACHRQHRPPRRRLRADGRAPGGLRAAGLSGRKPGAVHRPAPDRRQGRRAPYLGLRSLTRPR